MFTDVKPRKGFVKIAISREIKETKTASGLIIPDENNVYKNKLYRGKIIDIGPDIPNDALGSWVLCKYHTGIEVSPDVVLLEEKEILGFLP